MLYPRQFEIFRLEPLGEPPFFEPDDARRRHEEGDGLSVVPDDHPISWYLQVAPNRHRFSVTSYAPSGTPLRTMTWENEGDGLLCRRIIDLFYPQGDPGRRVPFVEVLTVTQDVATDGRLDVTLSSPLGDDEVFEVEGLTLDAFRTRIPAFGEWDELLEASVPAPVDRFGVDSTVAASAYALGLVTSKSRGGTDAARSGWRIPASDRDVMKTIDAIIGGESTRHDIPVLLRGAATVVPVAVQADRIDSARAPGEELRRMTVLASRIRDALEHREGRAISLDLDRRGGDPAASYGTALRSAGVTSADWWMYGGRRGVALVWTGDETEGTLTLAVHIVPVTWVLEKQKKAATERIDVRWSRSDIDAPDSVV